MGCTAGTRMRGRLTAPDRGPATRRGARGSPDHCVGWKLSAALHVSLPCPPPRRYISVAAEGEQLAAREVAGPAGGALCPRMLTLARVSTDCRCRLSTAGYFGSSASACSSTATTFTWAPPVRTQAEHCRRLLAHHRLRRYLSFHG